MCYQDRHLEQKTEFASAGGIPRICRAQRACDTKGCFTATFRCLSYHSIFSFSDSTEMDGGLHKEHYTTLCEEQLNDLTQLAAVRNYPFYISPAHRRNE